MNNRDDQPQVQDPQQLALEARLASVKAFYEAKCNMRQAVLLFNSGWNAQHPDGSPGHIAAPSEFIKYNVRKLESQYSLLTVTPPGRPPTLSDEQAKLAADLVAGGQWVECQEVVNGQLISYLCWCRFTSIKEAISGSPQLGQLCQQTGVGADYIRRRVLQVDHQLHYGPEPMKDTLSDSVMRERVTYCNDMNFRLDNNPDFMLDVYWMDECRIWIGRNEANKLMVWSRRGDHEGQPPLGNPLLGHHQGFCINLLLVVNARHGVVWVEFLSGTAGMNPAERHNPEMQQVMQDRGGQPYKVSGLNTMQLLPAWTSCTEPGSMPATHSMYGCC